MLIKFFVYWIQNFKIFTVAKKLKVLSLKKFTTVKPGLKSLPRLFRKFGVIRTFSVTSGLKLDLIKSIFSTGCLKSVFYGSVDQTFNSRGILKK